VIVASAASARTFLTDARLPLVMIASTKKPTITEKKAT
jgi:hypothetical protein